MLRREILEAESLTFDPDGGLHRHRRSVLSGDSAVRGRQSVETTSNDGAIGSGVEMASNGLVSI